MWIIINGRDTARSCWNYSFSIFDRRLLHYNTTLALILLLPLMYQSGELQAVSRVTFLTDFNFLAVNTATGITGFLINIAVFLQIKVTTPLTNTISGTAKVSFTLYKKPL